MMTPWLAHLYTASGAVLALLATLDVLAGNYRGAFIWLGVQVVVDATDGWLARVLRVKERLPHFDGARLDDLVDYLCYVFVPVLIVLHAGLLPPRLGVFVGSLVLLSSAYGFSQDAAKVKTNTDYFFTGFPSYWNLVAFYLYLWQLSPVLNAILLIGGAVLVFVPTRYVYPSRTRTLRPLTIGLGSVWGGLLAWMLWRLPDVSGPWSVLSLFFPVYYVMLSAWLDRRSRRPVGVGARA